MLPNNVLAVHWLEQVLAVKPKGVDTIFLGDLNAHLGETRNEREEDMATELADHDLENFTRNFTPWRRYRGRG